MPHYKRRSAGPKRMTVTSQKSQTRWEYLEVRAPEWIKPSLVMRGTFVPLAQSPNFASSASHWIKAAPHTVPWPFYARMQPARNPPIQLGFSGSPDILFVKSMIELFGEFCNVFFLTTQHGIKTKRRRSLPVFNLYIV